MKNDKDKIERGEVSRRDFLVGAGAVVVGGAIGAGITYPLVAGKGGEVVTTTKTVSVPTTVTTTVGGGATATVTTTVPGGTATVTSTVPGGTKTVTATVGEGVIEPAFEAEETKIHGTGHTAQGHAGPFAFIDVKNGRIVRIRPAHFTWKYPEFKSWTVEARGKVLDVGKKSYLCPFEIAQKARVYSPNRIRYPLKRVDWEPGGDPAKINAQNRGKSKYKRISWDEATNIIYSEIMRMCEKYGPEAIAVKSGSHGENKCVHASHGMPAALMALAPGQYTRVANSPISWEGSVWGSKHVWGFEPFGEEPIKNTLIDTCRNTEMMLSWPCDVECKAWMSSGQLPSLLCMFLKDIGIKNIYISPDLNASASVHADKWIPILPNTDAAMQLAIAYLWITEGTYDKEYIATHTVGFDKFSEYVMGDEDGIPKTPAWASPKCDVPEWTIKALAKEWASKVTSTAFNHGGGMCRGPYSHEMMRLNVLLLAMQGVGKPGVHQGAPRTMLTFGTSTGLHRMSTLAGFRGEAKLEKGYAFTPNQEIHENFFHDAIINPPVSWYAGGSTPPYAAQWVESHYPEEGYSRVHMLWFDSGHELSSTTSGFSILEGYRDPSIEFYLIQDIWLESDGLAADLVLPISTMFELDDIGYEDDAYSGLYLDQKCIEPIGESMSDYEGLIPLAEKLGVRDEFTGGKTVEEWKKNAFDLSGASDYNETWEDFKDKGYFLVGPDPGWDEQKPLLNGFYNDPVANPLPTATGKIQFYCEALDEHFPDDKERPPIPKWIIGGPAEEGWTHDESLWGERAKKYPLLLIANTPRWRVHGQMDDIPWIREVSKVKGPDGYLYEPIWMNPVDAAARGLRSEDIVKVYNERGAILAGLRVIERVMPKAVVVDHGSRMDPITTGIDRGGSANLICPGKTTSRHASGIVVTGYLVEVEKADLADLRSKYPEAFARDYDPACGIRLSAWIEGGM